MKAMQLGKHNATTYQVLDQYTNLKHMSRDNYPAPKTKSKDALNTLVKKTDIVVSKKVKISNHKRIKSAGTALIGAKLRAKENPRPTHKRTTTHSNIEPGQMARGHTKNALSNPSSVEGASNINLYKSDFAPSFGKHSKSYHHKGRESPNDHFFRHGELF